MHSLSQAPTLETLSACTAVEQVLSSFFIARSDLPPSPYEADVEAVNLFNLVVRQVQGVLVLARTDFSLIPPASTIARAAFETSIRAAWMVDADDPFVREARWLAHLEEAESANRRAGARSTMPDSTTRFTRHAEDIREFRQSVIGLMPKHVALLKSVPKLPEMIESIGGLHLYTLYIYLSQYAHGGHMAADLYRQHLGTEKKFGDFATPGHWYIALRLCLLSLVHPGNIILSRIRKSPVSFLAPEQEDATVKAIEAISVEATKVLH